MSYRIEHDDSAIRESFGPYYFRIYKDDQLIARYWHDYRGDDYGIEFLKATTQKWPFRVISDFIEGGGPEPLKLTQWAVAYLDGLDTDVA